MSNPFDLTKEMQDISSTLSRVHGEAALKNMNIIQGLAINLDDFHDSDEVTAYDEGGAPVDPPANIAILLHISSISPQVDTFEGSNNPHSMRLEISVYDSSVQDGEAEFYNKYYFQIFQAMQRNNWMCHGASSGSDLDNQIEMYLQMVFTKEL